MEEAISEPTTGSEIASSYSMQYALFIFKHFIEIFGRNFFFI